MTKPANRSKLPVRMRKILIGTFVAGCLITAFALIKLMGLYSSKSNQSPSQLPSKWVVKADTSVISTPLLYNRCVYAASLNGSVYSIDQQTGHVLWCVQMPSSIDTPPVVSKNGNILVGTADSGDVGCLSVNNGSTIWRKHLPKDITAELVVGADGTIYVVADHLYAIDPLKGTIKWTGQVTFNTSPNAGYAVDLVNQGDKLLVVADKVYACDKLSGALLWTCGDADGKPFKTAAAVRDNTSSPQIYVAGASSLTCIDVSKGKSVWTSPLPVADYSVPVFDGISTVYVTSRLGQLHAFDAKSGKTKWDIGCAESVSSDLTIDIPRSRLYFCDEKDRLHIYSIDKRADIEAISLLGGSLFEATSKETSKPVIAADGTVILGSDDGNIYAIKPRK